MSSRWIEIPKEDIRMNGEGDEIQMLFDCETYHYLDPDENGNKHIAIKTQDIINLLKSRGLIK